MAYPDPDTTRSETRARWHIEAAVSAQSKAETDDFASPDEAYHLASAANHAAIVSALIALAAVRAERIRTAAGQR